MGFIEVSLAAFLFAFVGSLPLAGPIALLVVSSGASGRYEEALRIALGAAVAEGIYAFLAFWGFATFLSRHALVLPISHGVTAVILFALGARFLFFKLKETEAKPGEPRKGGRFWVGFSVAAANPTLLATWGAVTAFLYAQQVVPLTSLLAIPFGALAAAGVAVWGLMTVGLLKRFRNKLPRAALTWLVRSMGVVLLCVGVWSGVKLGIWVLHPSARAASRIAVAATSRPAAFASYRTALSRQR